MNERIDKLIFEMERCCGCRTCELACSYHHRKVFQPSISSIEIKSTPQPFGFTATLYKESVEGHMGCDSCRGLQIPICVQFCPSSFRDELEDLLKKGHFRTKENS